MQLVFRLIISLFVFLIIILTGLWMNKSGKPYHLLVLTVHKLIATGFLVLAVYTIYRLQQTTPLQFLEFLVCAGMAAVFLSAIVTGGLLSTSRPMPSILSLLHKAFAYACVIITGVVIVLLRDRF